MSFHVRTVKLIPCSLAYAEFHVGLATVFRRFDLELYGTTREDVDARHDFFIAASKLNSKGMRVLVKDRF